MRNHLNVTYQNRWIGRGGPVPWPAWPPELTSLDYFLSGSVKSMVYGSPVTPERLSRAHSPTFTSLHLRQSSLSNPSVALPTQQLILQPLRCFTYVTAQSPTLISLFLRHRLFTYVTWRADHDVMLKYIAMWKCCTFEK